MGSNYDDTWAIYAKEFSHSAKYVADLKKIIIEHIKNFDVTKDVNSFGLEEYEIRNIKFSIKRKK